jgi:AcrR family transcriptional regulator
MAKDYCRMEPELRKATIYAAAHCLVSESGLKVTRKMVAGMCGVSPGLINKYFGSFAELLSDVCGDAGLPSDFKRHIPMCVNDRRESVIKWGVKVAQDGGVEKITNKLIGDECEIGTYRVYLIFGGVRKLRELITQRMQDEQNHF